MTAGYRCSQDVFGYCVNPDTPIGNRLTYTGKERGFLAVGTCRFHPAQCDHFRTFTQVLPDLSFLDKKRPPQSQNKRLKPSLA